MLEECDASRLDGVSRQRLVAYAAALARRALERSVRAFIATLVSSPVRRR